MKKHISLEYCLYHIVGDPRNLFLFKFDQNHSRFLLKIVNTFKIKVFFYNFLRPYIMTKNKC